MPKEKSESEGIKTEQLLSIISMYCEQSDFTMKVLSDTPIKAAKMRDNMVDNSDDDDEDPVYHIVSDAVLIIYDTPQGEPKRVYPISPELSKFELLQEISLFITNNTKLRCSNKNNYLIVSDESSGPLMI